ncbi:CaiB/BaiF CoA transferase family protein [Saccharopolyspora spinosa]|uniref:Crotonobetainyl-CoA:carnitine CoA-transferase CaiB-like acyl-CoA transferase n=1 Tax=Saccharopolyspora spinosa TaxID=60894 RepID=A0A2N3Y157_SACSN|nr:CoA transferase [Saccharopolyspora spinosa]PKW16674.1 crotonobetainyl-CoA:carnitine CoA-transferase CaiB-like acyl-CoA transferase [Saccharopolyspora spinosa]
MTGIGALSGLRIADFSRVLSGPYATMLLGDMGAEVIKVEHPVAGDETRSWGPPWYAGQATYYLGANRNKTATGIDLGTESGRAQARALIGQSDVVVQNFRPGTMERFGLGFDQLAAEFPRLVYCSISGFGSANGADLPGYDLIVQAAGGLMSITGPDEETPIKTGVALVDVISGLHAVTGILAALRYRDHTGVGQHVEVNLFSSLLSALANQAASYVATGHLPKALGNRHPSIAPYETMNTADRPLAVAAANDKLFTKLAQAIQRPDLISDERFATNPQRVAHREQLVKELEKTLTRAPADHWFALFRQEGVPCSPINGLDQAFELATSLDLDAVVSITCPDTGTTYPQVACPIRLSETPATYRLVPPPLPG